MIDTDKYEGHTPAPWMMSEYKGRPSIYAGDETFVRNIARGLNPSQTADHNLIADSPLLLAEVKRLREENEKQNNVLTTLDEMIQRGEEHVELMKALEQGLGIPETWKEMIE